METQKKKERKKQKKTKKKKEKKRKKTGATMKKPAQISGSNRDSNSRPKHWKSNALPFGHPGSPERMKRKQAEKGKERKMKNTKKDTKKKKKRKEVHEKGCRDTNSRPEHWKPNALPFGHPVSPEVHEKDTNKKKKRKEEVHKKDTNKKKTLTSTNSCKACQEAPFVVEMYRMLGCRLMS
nr:hypothetical protein BaRGS_014543 [Batillaria attramentaria]